MRYAQRYAPVYLTWPLHGDRIGRKLQLLEYYWLRATAAKIVSHGGVCRHTEKTTKELVQFATCRKNLIQKEGRFLWGKCKEDRFNAERLRQEDCRTKHAHGKCIAIS